MLTELFDPRDYICRFHYLNVYCYLQLSVILIPQYNICICTDHYYHVKISAGPGLGWAGEESEYPVCDDSLLDRVHPVLHGPGVYDHTQLSRRLHNYLIFTSITRLDSVLS